MQPITWRLVTNQNVSQNKIDHKIKQPSDEQNYFNPIYVACSTPHLIFSLDIICGRDFVKAFNKNTTREGDVTHWQNAWLPRSRVC